MKQGGANCMLETLFNLPDDPLLYATTMTLFLSLSLTMTWVLLFEYEDSASLRRPKFVDSSYSIHLSIQNRIVTDNLVIHWIAQYIKLKESPGDDSDDHQFFLNIS